MRKGPEESAYRMSIVLSSLMIYHHIISMSNTTDATVGAGTAYPSRVPEVNSCCPIVSFLCSK